MSKRKFRKKYPVHHYLVAWREQCGYTPAELAKAMKVDRAAISRWESGERSPHINHLASYASVFGCDVQELFGPPPSVRRNYGKST